MTAISAEIYGLTMHIQQNSLAHGRRYIIRSAAMEALIKKLQATSL